MLEAVYVCVRRWLTQRRAEGMQPLLRCQLACMRGIKPDAWSRPVPPYRYRSTDRSTDQTRVPPVQTCYRTPAVKRV